MRPFGNIFWCNLHKSVPIASEMNRKLCQAILETITVSMTARLAMFCPSSFSPSNGVSVSDHPSALFVCIWLAMATSIITYHWQYVRKACDAAKGPTTWSWTFQASQAEIEKHVIRPSSSLSTELVSPWVQIKAQSLRALSKRRTSMETVEIQNFFRYKVRVKITQDSRCRTIQVWA